MKGCLDGKDCPKRNTCARYQQRTTLKETMRFWILYNPECTFYVKQDKKVKK